MSEELTRLQQKYFGNPNGIYKPHESKPIRAGLAGLTAGIVDTVLVPKNLIDTALEGTFTGKSYKQAFLENMSDVNKVSNKIHDFFGANRPEDQDKTEKTFSFAGDMLPVIGTLGSYGLVKTPISLISKGAKKAARNTFRKVATEEMSKVSKPLRQAVLHEANRGTKFANVDKFMRESQNFGNTFYNKPLGVARQAAIKEGSKGQWWKEMLLPGIQVERTEELLPRYLKTGIISNKDYLNALKKVRTHQAIIGGAQALPNTVSYISDMLEKDDIQREDLDKQLRKQESNWLLPASLMAVSIFGSGYALRKLGQIDTTQYKQLINNYKQQKLEIDLETKPYQVMDTLSQTRNPIATNVYDSTSFIDDPRFSWAFDDVDKANLRYDTSTSINSYLNTGYPIQDKVNIKPVELYRNLNDLQVHHPNLWQTLEDYLDTNNKIASITDTINAESFGIEGYSKYLATDAIDSTKDITKLHQKLRELRTISRQLRKDVEANPVLNKLAKDISRDSEIRLDLAVKSGRIDPELGKYLKKNYTIDGYYSYKPFKEDIPDQSVLNKVNKFLFSQEYANNFPLYGRVARDLEKPAMSYTDTYRGAVMRDLRYAQQNSVIKQTVLKGLDKQYVKLTDLNRDIGVQKSELKALEDKLAQIIEPTTPKAEKYVTNLKKEYESRTKLLQRLEQKALNLTHFEYIGSRVPRTGGKIVISTSPYRILNNPKYTPFENIQSYVQKRVPSDVMRDIANYQTSKDIIRFTDANGVEQFFRVNPLLKHVLDYNPEVPNAFSQGMLALKRIKQETTTGSFNPGFAVTSMLYGLQESMTALTRIIKNPFNIREVFENIKYNGIALRDQVVRDMKQDIVNRWKSEWIRTMGNMSASPMSKKYTEDAIRKMEVDIEDCLLTKFEKAGAVTYRNPEGFNGREFALSATTDVSDKFKRYLTKIHGAEKGMQCARFLDYCTNAMRNASTVGLMLQMNAKKQMKNAVDMRLSAAEVSKYVTDSKKSGLGVGALGNVLGFIGKYVPYGRVGINSIGAKIAALNVSDGITFLKAAKEQIKQSPNKVIDTLNMVKIGSKGLIGNQYLQSLYFTALVPTTICYLWNHMNQDNKEDYHRLSDFDKSSKLILANFYGKGNHLTVPLDQEIGVGCKLFETMLDSTLNLSKDNGVDPAFQQSRLLGAALARSLNVENMVLPEAMLNMAGYTADISVGTGEGIVRQLPQNTQNLDGSKTALQNGIFTQEATALMNTMFGAVGSALVRGTESANIGIRDKGIASGLKDFVQAGYKSMSRSIPFGPNSDMTIRGTTQTAKVVKNKIETIDKLRKLNIFNTQNHAFVGKSGAKSMLDVPVQQLDPSLQFASEIARDAVPYYNQNIKPIYDKISALYKQTSAFNASGRDIYGNTLNVYDRFNYQQKKNKEIQDIYKQLYFEFDKLERMLTKKYNRDIVLTEFNSLQGV